MNNLITDKIKKLIDSSVLCWLATCDTDGQPNVSPKEIFCVFDENYIVIANIASPKSKDNIIHNEKVCLSLIDILIQKGFKIIGNAKNLSPSDNEFSKYISPLLDMVGDKFNIHSIFLMEVLKVEPIIAPSYRFFPEITTEQQQIESAKKRYLLL